MKWKIYRNGEESSGCDELKRRRGRQVVPVALSGKQRNPCGVKVFCVLTASLSVSWLWYCTTVLQDVTTGGKLLKGAHGISLYYFLQLYANLNYLKEKVSWKGKPICCHKKHCWVKWQTGMWAAYEIMVSTLNALVFITVLWLCKRLPLFLENIEVLYFELKGCDTHTHTYIHTFSIFAVSLLHFYHIVNYYIYF